MPGWGADTATGDDMQSRTLAMQFVDAYNERLSAVQDPTTSGEYPVAAFTPMAYPTAGSDVTLFWKTLQGAVYGLRTKFVRTDVTPDPATTWPPDLWSSTTFPPSGLTRKISVAGVITSATAGVIQTGDILGAWIPNDIKTMLNLLTLTYTTNTAFVEFGSNYATPPTPASPAIAEVTHPTQSGKKALRITWNSQKEAASFYIWVKDFGGNYQRLVDVQNVVRSRTPYHDTTYTATTITAYLGLYNDSGIAITYAVSAANNAGESARTADLTLTPAGPAGTVHSLSSLYQEPPYLPDYTNYNNRYGWSDWASPGSNPRPITDSESDAEIWYQGTYPSVPPGAHTAGGVTRGVGGGEFPGGGGSTAGLPSVPCAWTRNVSLSTPPSTFASDMENRKLWVRVTGPNALRLTRQVDSYMKAISLTTNCGLGLGSTTVTFDLQGKTFPNGNTPTQNNWLLADSTLTADLRYLVQVGDDGSTLLPNWAATPTGTTDTQAKGFEYTNEIRSLIQWDVSGGYTYHA
jgi:hypothetical protein